MMDEKQGRHGPIWWGSGTALIIYVFSFGPSVALYQLMGEPEAMLTFLNAFYAPIGLLGDIPVVGDWIMKFLVLQLHWCGVDFS